MNLLRKVYLTLRGVSEHPLYRANKLSAMLEFCLVQVAVRLVPGEIAVPYPNGARLLVPPRMKGAAHFIIPRLPEFEVMSFVLHFLRPTDTFVDVGANIGAYTVLAGKSVGTKTVSVEASNETFRVLERNICLNSLGNSARLHNVAAGAKTGHLHFTQGLGTENRVAHRGEANGYRIEMQALDTLLMGTSPTGIKIDVEGFESEVIAGAGNLLENPSLQFLIIERAGSGSDYSVDENKLHARIRALGFQPTAYDFKARQLIRLKDEDIGNIIYVRDWKFAAARLATGKGAELDRQII